MSEQQNSTAETGEDLLFSMEAEYRENSCLGDIFIAELCLATLNAYVCIKIAPSARVLKIHWFNYNCHKYNMNL